MTDRPAPTRPAPARPVTAPRRLPGLLLALALGVVLATMGVATRLEAATGVSIPSGSRPGLAIPGKLYRPSGTGRAPAVILMHGCGGWQPAVLAALDRYARYLSSKGMVVLNLDSFGPRHNSGGVVCSSFQRLASARDYRTQDAFDALKYLRAQPFVDPGNVFLIGQSNGGSVALIAAKSTTERKFAPGGDGFRGVVALYPWCGAAGSLRPRLATPVLILGGARDDWVPPANCTRIAPQGASVDVKVFPKAAHSFDLQIPLQRYYGKLVGFDPDAAAKARVAILSFIKSHATRRF